MFFKKGRTALLALTETKMRENGEISWVGINCICRITIKRKEYGILLSYVLKFGYISSRIL